MNEPGTLEIHANIDWRGDFFELAACELAAGAFASLIGLTVLGPMAAVGGFGVGFIAALVAATVYKPELSTGECSQPSKHELVCHRPAKFAFTLAGKAFDLLTTSATAGSRLLISARRRQLRASTGA